jgi:hypothetical protein
MTLQNGTLKYPGSKVIVQLLTEKKGEENKVEREEERADRQTDSVSRAAFTSGRSFRKQRCLAWGKVTPALVNHSQ